MELTPDELLQALTQGPLLLPPLALPLELVPAVTGVPAEPDEPVPAELVPPVPVEGVPAPPEGSSGDCSTEQPIKAARKSAARLACCRSMVLIFGVGAPHADKNRGRRRVREAANGPERAEAVPELASTEIAHPGYIVHTSAGTRQERV